MPDGALKLELTGPLADDIRAAAAARGLSPEEYVRLRLEAHIAFRDDEDDLDIEEDVRRLNEPGEDVDAETAFAEFREEVVKARSVKA